MKHVVVVGASLAGLRAAETLRQGGFAGGITFIGGEAHLPYDRPPLSKKLLAGEWEPERIALRKPEAFAELDLVWRLGVPASSLDTAAKRVHLADGTSETYDGLVIATGATPIRLPGQRDVVGVHQLRSLDDALALRARLQPGRRMVVIGAGFIGLEAAATAHAAGCEVTVLEGLPTPLVRALGPDMGTAIAAVHRRRGVTVRCEVRVEAIELDESGLEVSGVRLAGGEVLPADDVLVGIGVRPATAWLEGAEGIELRDGVVCDATLAAGPAGVVAAGDLVRWPNRAFGHPDSGEEMRVEHWTNAAEQGAAAARTLLAWAAGEEPSPYQAIPFFWSDQFDARIQFLGRASGDDDVEVAYGSVDDARFVALYSRDGVLRGALGVSSPRVLMPLRTLLMERAPVEVARAQLAAATA
jgi:3-phenylpropionate/trans-cinnamate dioxygenase ferredoxin reductase subunit